MKPPAPSITCKEREIDDMRFRFLKMRLAVAIERGDADTAARMSAELALLFKEEAA